MPYLNDLVFDQLSHPIWKVNENSVLALVWLVFSFLKTTSIFQMESLAHLVVALTALMFITGLSAVILTFWKTNALSNVTAKPLQRILTMLLGLISFMIGVQFVTQVDSLGGRVIGGFGITFALIAFYRVIKK